MGKAKTADDTMTLLPLDDSKKPEQPKSAKRTSVAVRSNRSDQPTKVTQSESAKSEPPINMLTMLMQLAANPDVQPDKMRDILAIQKEIAAEERRMAFTRAQIQMRPHLPIIDERGRIVAEGKPGKKGYVVSHAKMIDINLAIKPILDKFGFNLWFEPDVAADGKLLQIGHLDHVEGHSRSCRVPMTIDASGGKNNQQGVGSSYRYAQRYATIFLLNLDSRAPIDADDDAQAAGRLEKPQTIKTETIEALTKKQVDELRKAIKDCGATEEMFCTRFQVDRIENMPPTQFGEALQACRSFAERTKGAARGS